jgi:phosphoglycolate phosphatase-like HAD superfamily hydrolase
MKNLIRALKRTTKPTQEKPTQEPTQNKLPSETFQATTVAALREHYLQKDIYRARMLTEVGDTLEKLGLSDLTCDVELNPIVVTSTSEHITVQVVLLRKSPLVPRTDFAYPYVFRTTVNGTSITSPNDLLSVIPANAPDSLKQAMTAAATAWQKEISAQLEAYRKLYERYEAELAAAEHVLATMPADAAPALRNVVKDHIASCKERLVS